MVRFWSERLGPLPGPRSTSWHARALALALLIGWSGAALGETCDLQHPLAPPAAFSCGLSIYLATGPHVDRSAAAAWFRRAAEAGDARAQNNLGHMYLDGDGVPQSDTYGFHWLERAAEAGYVKAMYSVGFLYEFGRGVPQDHVKAADWYARAAEEGHAQAQNNLGNLRMYGIGVAKDLDGARRLFEAAANQGNPAAAYNLGWLHDQGLGVPYDRIAAYQWFFVARSLGDPSLKLHALEALHRLEPMMSPDEKQAAEAWLRSWRPLAR